MFQLRSEWHWFSGRLPGKWRKNRHGYSGANVSKWLQNQKTCYSFPKLLKKGLLDVQQNLDLIKYLLKIKSLKLPGLHLTVQLKTILDFIICKLHFLHSEHFSTSNLLQKRSPKVPVRPQQSLIPPTVKHEVIQLKTLNKTQCQGWASKWGQ